MGDDGAKDSNSSLLGGDDCHGHSHGSGSDDQKRALLYTLILTFVFVVAQIIASVIANSLSLLADALHHLVDCVIVLTALLAIELAQRVPADSMFNRIYVDSSGNRHHCIELLVATGNCALLIGMSAGIIIDAALRLHGHDHMDIDANLIVIIGALSLLVNIAKMYLLHAHMFSSLNVRAVYIHTVADCLGAVALLAGGIALMVTGDNDWDGIAALVIAGLVIVNVFWVIVPTAQLLWQGPDHAATAAGSTPPSGEKDVGAAATSEGGGANRQGGDAEGEQSTVDVERTATAEGSPSDPPEAATTATPEGPAEDPVDPVA